MSILSVANVHFETTGANRIEYLAANGFLNLVTSGNIAISSRNFTLTAVGASGNVLTSNGTTWISQAPSVTAQPGTTGNVLVSNGTSWVSQAPGASGLSITNETASSSTYYPTLSTATTGSIAAANTSSTKLYYVPSTGTLSATIFNSLSDENQKTDVQPINNPLEITDNLRGVWFKWVDNGATSMGLIAQEVEKVLPELVSENNGLKTLNYDALIGLLIEDIKALKAKIEKLEKNG